MKTNPKLQVLAECIAEQSLEHVRLVGGWPAEVAIVGNRIVVAEVDDPSGKPMLQILTLKQAEEQVREWDEWEEE